MSPNARNSMAQASSTLVELMLGGFDELVEVDMNANAARSLKHTAGKYFTPRVKYAFRDLFYYMSEYTIHPDDQNRYLRECDPDRIVIRLRDPENHGVVRDRFRYKTMDGRWLPVEQVCAGGPELGLPDGVYYTFLYDVHDGAEPTVDNSRERNTLTGLLWDDQFFEQAQGHLRGRKGAWCVVAIDLEHFKIFNEWYDRTRGDQLLTQIGARLMRVERNLGGLACYLGQDDFAVLMPDDQKEIKSLYEDIHDLIKNYGTSVGFMPAFGICPIEGDSPIEELYDRAAMAARRAKDDYHNRIRRFEPAMYEKPDQDYRILSDFQRALRDHEIYFQLQPQYHIQTQKVVGAESLVRWKKASGESVSPGVFVPVLEQYGFITELDKYVWEEVCAWQKKWLDGGHAVLPVSVNVSQMDMFAINVPEHFENLIRQYALPVGALKIEIAESAYADNGVVADTIRALREKGFLVLMDDFGSGYSSLNILRNLNVDIIKLDAQFLGMRGEDRKGIHIMESIVNMAKTMGVPIIVEGVESTEETKFLEELGCRYVQGYFFQRPMAVEDYEALIADPERIDTRGFRFKADEQFHTREFLDQNVFSDTALNNILGPVAFYSWHGGDVDIVRFNQQFCDEVKIANLQENAKSVQRLMPPEDLPRVFKLFRRAMEDPLNGAVGEIRFNSPDGMLRQFRVHFFFLEEEKDGSRKFYGSIHDLTDFVTLNDHMRLLSEVSTDSIVFVRRTGGNWVFRVVIHGLADTIGLNREELQQELSDGGLYARVEERVREQLKGFALGMIPSTKGFSDPFYFTTPSGRRVPLRAWFFGAHDKNSGVEYIVILRSGTVDTL